MNIKSLFIAIAPNHISNFESIIKSYPEVKSPILLNPGGFDYDKSIWSQTIEGTLDLRYRESGSLDKLKYQVRKLVGYKNFIKEVRGKIRTGNKYNFYYCNLDDVLSNNMFHYLIDQGLSFKNFVVEDGVLNYYYPEIDLPKLKSKKFFCEKLLGVKFVPQEVHPTGINSDLVAAQYVRLPNRSISPKKSIRLPFSEISYEPIENVVLIIGQDIFHNYNEGPEYYKQRLKKLLYYVKTRSNHEKVKVVYKPHRNGDHKIAERILNNVFDDFELYPDVTPIEECIVYIKPKGIYSFNSSALLNLKMAFSDMDINIAGLPYNNNHPDLMMLFKNTGIEILE